MSKQFRQGFLAGTSTRGESVTQVVHGEFDFSLFSSSWDERCLSVTAANMLKSRQCAVFIPSLRDDLGLMDRHDLLLLQYAAQIGECSELRGDSAHLEPIWQNLLAHVRNAHRELERPLRLFVDLSTCPRFLSMGLIAYTLYHGIADEISCYYAEGDYPEEQSEEDQHELFTAGGWDAVPVPSLEGEWDPGKQRAYVVSVGFEGSKTLRLVSREEPDTIAVLFPDPGVKQDYAERTRRLNTPLFERFRIQEQQVVRASAGDAIEAWEQLDHFQFECRDEQNLYYICCGTKAHTLAMTLRAIVLRYPAVLYVVPDRHRVAEVKPLGVYWRFDIADMSSVRVGNRDR